MATIARSQAAGFTDYGAEAEDIARRRKMAEMMQMQALEPIKQETAGGYVVPISWTQGLAKALQAGVGGYQQGQLKDEARQLADRRNQALAQAISGMPQATTETAPGPDDGSGIPSPNVTTTKQPTWQQQAGWLGNLAQIGPEATALGSTVLGMRQKEQENEANREARTLDRIMTLEARAQDRAMTLEARAEAQRAAEALRRDLAAAEDRRARDLAAQSGDLRRELRGMAATSTPVTAVTIQDPNDPNSTIIIDGRTRQVLGKGPKLSQTGTANFKQMQSMQGLGSDLQAAEDLLMGQKRDSEGNVTPTTLPTGSGIGSLIDTAGSVFGVSVPGASEASSLKAISAKLVGKVPRFEGPQSDKDVALYKQAAGDAGNEKLPRETRLAAIRTMRDIYNGYESGARGRLLQSQMGSGATANFGTSADSPPPGAVRLKSK